MERTGEAISAGRVTNRPAGGGVQPLMTSDDEGRVIAIELEHNELTGEIPQALGKLTKLETLCLPGNPLSGPIPPELSGLSELRNLELWNNRLSGEMPFELGNLSILGNHGLGNSHLRSHTIWPPEPQQPPQAISRGQSIGRSNAGESRRPLKSENPASRPEAADPRNTASIGQPLNAGRPIPGQ